MSVYNEQQVKAQLGEWEKSMVKKYGKCKTCSTQRTIYDANLGNGYMFAKCDECGIKSCIDSNIVVVLM